MGIMGIEVTEVTIEGQIIIMVDLMVVKEIGKEEDHNNVEIIKEVIIIKILTNHNNPREISKCNSNRPIKYFPIRINNSLMCLLRMNKSHHNNSHK